MAAKLNIQDTYRVTFEGETMIVHGYDILRGNVEITFGEDAVRWMFASMTDQRAARRAANPHD